MVELELPAQATVATALGLVVADVPALRPLVFDASGNLQPNLVIFRNGRSIDFLAGLSTPLEGGQTLDLFPRTGAQRALVKEQPE
jgi:molybdopterin converting factor small subunit